MKREANRKKSQTSRKFISCLSKYLYKIERTCSGLPQVMGLSSLDVFASWYLCNHFRISGGCSEWRQPGGPRVEGGAPLHSQDQSEPQTIKAGLSQRDTHPKLMEPLAPYLVTGNNKSITMSVITLLRESASLDAENNTTHRQQLDEANLLLSTKSFLKMHVSSSLMSILVEAVSEFQGIHQMFT